MIDPRAKAHLSVPVSPVTKTPLITSGLLRPTLGLLTHSHAPFQNVRSLLMLSVTWHLRATSVPLPLRCVGPRARGPFMDLPTMQRRSHTHSEQVRRRAHEEAPLRRSAHVGEVEEPPQRRGGPQHRPRHRLDAQLGGGPRALGGEGVRARCARDASTGGLGQGDAGCGPPRLRPDEGRRLQPCCHR